MAESRPAVELNRILIAMLRLRNSALKLEHLALSFELSMKTCKRGILRVHKHQTATHKMPRHAYAFGKRMTLGSRCLAPFFRLANL